MAPKPAPKKTAKTVEPESTVSRFTLDGEIYEIDPENLTWGEMEDMEEEFGGDLESLSDTRSLIALVALAVCRKTPEMALHDARVLVRSKSIKTFGVEERPTSTPATDGSQS